MYDRKTTLEILEQAKSIDPGFITYESAVHKYVLNAPVDTELVRQADVYTAHRTASART